MNLLGAAASRILCSNPRTLSKCKTIDNFIGKVTFSPVRPYSISSTPFRRKGTGFRNVFAAEQIPSALKTTASRSPRLYGEYATNRIIRRYEDVPRNYKDGEGLPFRCTLLSKDEAVAIFGPGMDTGMANRVMKILHGRRVSGTLADPSLIFPASGYSDQVGTLALSWLRENIPVDEDDAAGKRAEVELEAMEQEALADSERLGLYKRDSSEVTSKKKKKKGKHTSVYGESGLDYIRGLYKQRALQREKEEEEVRKRQAAETRQNTGTLATQNAKSRAELSRPKEMHPKLKYYLERSKVLPDVPPEMSAWERLWPSGIFTLFVVATSVAVAMVYIPPTNSARLWPDIPPAVATILPIFVINTVIFIAWRVPPAFRILNMYFMSVPGYPRAFAVLGNTFSHQMLSHFLSNMVMLWLLGPRLHDDVGRANFLALYLSSGVIASFSSLCVFAYTRRFTTSSIGSSGSGYGMAVAYLWLHFHEKFKIFGLPPDPWSGIPGWAFLVVIALSDLYGMRAVGKPGGIVDHYAHFGGSVTGLLGAEILKRRAKERQRLQLERRKKMSRNLN